MFNDLYLVLAMLASTLSLYAQSTPPLDTFIDPRDQVAYPIVQIGQQRWLGTDLQYISPKAYFQDSAAATIGNFYYWEEAQTVCPEGWRLTQKEDWANLGIVLLHQKVQANPAVFQDLEAFLVNSVDQLSIVFKPNTQHGFFREATPLYIDPLGRVESGTTIASRSFIDYWVTPLSSRHSYYHIHVRRYSLEGHSHRHHIHAGSRKRRMFRVRCVAG